MEAAVLTDRFPRTQVLPSQDMPTYQVAGEDLLETVRFLRDDQGFDLLADLCGIDWKDRTPRFGVVIHLLSTTHKEYVRLHVGAVNDAIGVEITGAVDDAGGVVASALIRHQVHVHINTRSIFKINVVWDAVVVAIHCSIGDFAEIREFIAIAVVARTTKKHILMIRSIGTIAS